MMAEPFKKRPVLIKLNVPFCYQHCDFCSRDIFPGHDASRMHLYVTALLRELLSNATEFADCEVRAVHLGGGIASQIEGPDLLRLFRTLQSNYDISQNAPVTMRAAMSEVNGGQMPFFRRVGIARYDFELMSLDRRDFAHLSFPDHTGWIQTASSSFLHAEKENNMGFVLIYGKRDVDAAHFRHSLVLAARTHCCHIILQQCAGKDAGDEGLLAAQTAEANDVLPKAGFHKYLPGRWAKDGCDDAYAVMKAGGMDELSFGLGAVTRFDGAVSGNTMDLETYLNCSDQYEAITAYHKVLNV